MMETAIKKSYSKQDSLHVTVRQELSASFVRKRMKRMHLLAIECRRASLTPPLRLRAFLPVIVMLRQETGLILNQ